MHKYVISMHQLEHLSAVALAAVQDGARRLCCVSVLRCVALQRCLAHTKTVRLCAVGQKRARALSPSLSLYFCRRWRCVLHTALRELSLPVLTDVTLGWGWSQ